MKLKTLSLVNFKNYSQLKVDFISGVQCFLGRNGSGKTNLLDAIHYLSFTKSAFNSTDAQHVCHGEDHFIIRGDFDFQGAERSVSCVYQNQKKTMRVDEKEVLKLSKHIGEYPVVLVGPNDIELIWNGSALRRKFFDSMIAQIDADYLQHLIVYTQTLRQRNSLLRMYASRNDLDKDMLESYNQKLISSGTTIFKKRTSYVQEFLPLIKKHYKSLAGDQDEDIHINF
ncbi:MAG: DNA replication/repair protein RecF [Flammeovirgaceae bacterium]|nr:DNA replication/repair protein RecF [Flammeovirgaceae bacterium]